MKPVWHCYANDPALRPGDAILVTGGDGEIALFSNAILSIDLPDGQRVDAVINQCDHDRMTLAVLDNDPLLLHRSDDEMAFADFKLSDGFSRQVWIID